MIFARKINKIPEFYTIFVGKMAEFYIIIVRKIFFPDFFWGGRARAPLCPRLLRLKRILVLVLPTLRPIAD